MRKIDGSYIYNKIFSLLDYNGEIARSENITGYQYSNKFSPNNIKRLIISPDIVFVNYHTAISDKGKQQSIILNPIEVNQAEKLPDYKPMMNILSTKRICGSIEEIIFITRSKNSNITLASNELNLENLIKGYGSRTNDIRGTISSRYKRLYSIAIVDMNIDEFMFYMKQAGKDYEFITDLPFMSNAKIEYFHKDDWYESWGYAGQTYPMDKTDGVLHKHFSEIKSRKIDQLKKEAINNYKLQGNKVLVDEVTTLYKKYHKMVKMYQKLYKLFSDIGYNSICFEKLTTCELITLYPCEAFSNYPRLQNVKDDKVDVLNTNKELLSRGIHDLVGYMSRTLIESVATLCDKMPVTAKALMNVENEYTVVVPNDVASLNEKIALTTNKKYEGSSVMNSYINSCWLYSSFFLNRNQEGFHKEFITREYWKGMIK